MADKKKAETKPRLSAIERAEKLLAEAKEKEAARVAKVKDADVLAYAKAKTSYSKAVAKFDAAVKVLVDVHGMTTDDLDAIDVAAVIAAAPAPKPRTKAEPTEA